LGTWHRMYVLPDPLEFRRVIAGHASDMTRVWKPTSDPGPGVGGVDEGRVPCVRRWRFALERTVNDFLQPETGHLKAKCEGGSTRLVTAVRIQKA